MTLQQVVTNKDIKLFLKFPVQLYKNKPNWIRPLDKDIESVFDPKENKSFRFGTAIRWILKNNSNEVIGRIAAFTNSKTGKSGSLLVGGMGFFECIEDQDAAFVLFDSAKEWLLGQNCNAIDGPINYGERDRWWGLHIEGDIEPNYGMFYHHFYYKAFFENYGFQNYFEQYTFSMMVRDELPDSYKEKAIRIARDSEYHFKCFEKKLLSKYAEDFCTIYNQAWVKHDGTGAMKKAQVEGMFKKMLPVLDPDIIIFAYHGDKPVGFFLMLPELNQIFKYINGNLNWLGKLKFFYHQKMKSCRKIFGVVFGVVPEYQGKGMEGALVMESARIVQPAFRYDTFEMNWVGDFNPKMIRVAETLGAKICKKHITYRLILDQNIAFERMKVIK